MTRFLVSSAHSRREPYHRYVLEADSADEIAARYPWFAEQPILGLPEERPTSISDDRLAALEARSYRLGDPEPEWLTTLVDRLTNGPPWEWYFLKRWSDDGELVDFGEFGTFRRFEIGDDIGGLPRTEGRRWRVVAIEASADPRCGATLVVEPIE